MGRYDRCQVGEAFSLGDVLVDRDAGEKAKAPLVAGAHHLLVAERAAADEVIPLNGGSG